MTSRLLDSLATTGAMAAVFSDASLLGAMLQFETALARVEAQLGIIPAAAAEHIERAAQPGFFDAAAIAERAHSSGTIAIPLVEALRARVREIDASSATFVHWGATSQDVTDTALVVCIAKARPILTNDHDQLSLALRRLSDEHATTVMLARTLLQPAAPTTFGLKVAGWCAAIERSWVRLSLELDDALILQCGGAAGTLAALGGHGPTVAAALARELHLGNPAAPWHAHRDRLAGVVAACGIYTATLGKAARDVTLLMQHEVGEASEPGGGSSAMPHKRNPAGCAIVLAAATRLPGLVASYLSGAVSEHERGVGGWHAEAPTVAAAVQTTGAAVAAMRDVIVHLRVDRGRMRANVEATRGAIFAERAMTLLAPVLGRETAVRLVAAALDVSGQGDRTFGQALAAVPDVRQAVAAEDLKTLEAPEAYLGAADILRRELLKTSTA